MIERIISAIFPEPPAAPDLARFPDLPPCGYAAEDIAALKAACARLETPAYRRIQAARRQKASKS